ncbi:MAG: hypothetical protein ACHQK8_05790, partial [Bacteroidia bacterium]
MRKSKKNTSQKSSPLMQATKKRELETELLRKNKNLLPSLAVVLIITFITYFPCINNDFTNWDDLGYVTENTLLPKNKAVDYFYKDAIVMSNYHPLTMITLSLEYAWVKLKPKQYHVDNLLLHLLNTALV